MLGQDLDLLQQREHHARQDGEKIPRYDALHAARLSKSPLQIAVRQPKHRSLLAHFQHHVAANIRADHRPHIAEQRAVLQLVAEHLAAGRIRQKHVYQSAQHNPDARIAPVRVRNTRPFLELLHVAAHFPDKRLDRVRLDAGEDRQLLKLTLLFFQYAPSHTVMSGRHALPSFYDSDYNIQKPHARLRLQPAWDSF